MEDELDQELIDLLEIEENKELKPIKPTATIPVPEPVIEQVKPEKPQQIQETLEPPITQMPKLVPEPIITPVVISKEETTNLLPEAQEEKIFASKEFLEKFVSVANSIVENHTIDRNQIEEAIKYFSEEVKEARALGLKLPPALIDGWVKLLATKSDVNANATGVLDSMAKLLAAAKNNNLIININDNKSGINLEEILSQPAKEDEIK